MIKVNSVSGFTCYVKDLDRTAAFYEALGFRVGKRDDMSITFYVNWFLVTFVAQSSATEEFTKEAEADPKGAGIYINISVQNVDEFYGGVLANGMQPSSEPRDWPWGTREFVLRDPDGYKLVFFQKLK